MSSDRQNLETSRERKSKTSFLLRLLACLFWGGCWLVASTPASARPLPRPPDVIPGLPPSPNVAPPPPQDRLPTLSPNPAGRREFDFQAPPPRTRNRNRDENFLREGRTSQLYGVYINGDSPLLLAQVRRIEPEAFVRHGGGMIQAGVFSDQSNAQQRVQALEEWGIMAQVNTYSGDNVDSRPVERGRDEIDGVAYFVVVPGSKDYLPDIAAQMIRLGFPENAVAQRNSPRGPHVAIGPFAEQSEAERWTSFLRSNGMDARVYFGR